jgi:hypothetical protein
VLYQSREARDAALRTGVEQGVAASYDRLAELVASQWTRGKPHRRRRSNDRRWLVVDFGLRQTTIQQREQFNHE